MAVLFLSDRSEKHTICLLKSILFKRGVDFMLFTKSNLGYLHYNSLFLYVFL
jgi:hypothetical protein